MKHQHPDNISLNFIVCTARTGSTLLASMLNMHPNVVSVWEETFAYSLFIKYKNEQDWNSNTIQRFCRDFYLFSDGKLEPQFGTKKELESILEQNKAILNAERAIKLTYLCFFPKKDKSEVTTLVDKQLYFHSVIEEVASFYPKARFILLSRDPRDNALVKWRMAQRNNKKGYYPYYAFIWRYVFGILLRKKKKIGAERFLDVKYEDLVREPELYLHNICSFLNISYSPLMLKYDDHLKSELSSTEATYSESLKKNIDVLHKGLTEKVNTKKVGFWKQNLKPEEANLIWKVCGKVALDLGYHSDGCKPKVKINLEYILCYFKFLWLLVFIPGIYFKTPVFIRDAIKRIRYRKQYKVDRYTGKDFYETTFKS